MAKLTVNRTQVLRSNGADELGKLFGRGVTRYVHAVPLALVDDGTDFVQSVDDPVHGRLVAGDGTRRKDHRVAGLYRHDLVLSRCDQRQGGQRLSLRAGTDDDRSFGRVILDRFDGEERIVCDGQDVELASHLHVRHHRAAREGDLSAGIGGRVADLLDPVQVRSETRHDYPTGGGREKLLEPGAYQSF
jgi:hypothetical protein